MRGFKSRLASVRDSEVKAAPRAMFEDLFEDYYKHRYRLYFMNMIRGIFFGFGSAIGATILVAIVLWVLSLFDGLPFIGDDVNSLQDAIRQAR